jgi:hypothetical protein
MSEMSKSGFEMCSTLALYGAKPTEAAIIGFYHTIVNWFTELGHPPDKLAIEGTGYSGKPATFKRMNAKLNKNGFAQVESVTFFSMLPEGEIPMSDYWSTAWYVRNHRYTYAVVVVRSSLANLENKSMLPIAQMLIQQIEPDYGIGYTMEHRLQPDAYAIGLSPGDENGNYEEQVNISRWGDIGMQEHVYRRGIIRNVYAWNFLTAVQLTATVGEMSLEEWIKQDSKRGYLSLLSNGVTLWQVNKEEITNIRAELKQAGRIFNWRSWRNLTNS